MARDFKPPTDPAKLARIMQELEAFDRAIRGFHKNAIDVMHADPVLQAYRLERRTIEGPSAVVLERWALLRRQFGEDLANRLVPLRLLAARPYVRLMWLGPAGKISPKIIDQLRNRGISWSAETADIEHAVSIVYRQLMTPIDGLLIKVSVRLESIRRDKKWDREQGCGRIGRPSDDPCRDATILRFWNLSPDANYADVARQMVGVGWESVTKNTVRAVIQKAAKWGEQVRPAKPRGRPTKRK